MADRNELPQPYYVGRATAQQGAGAWQWYYRYQADPTDPAVLPRYQAGVKAFKQALYDNGYSQGLVLGLGVWGNYARDRAADFQQAMGLGADGVVGPVTAKALLRTYVVYWERHYAVPDHLLGKQGSLESGNDPVAQGWADAGDEGWAQIHLPYHPEITQAQAWDPKYAVQWMAGQLWSNRMNLGDYDAALAAYNVGYSTAKLWLAAGKPASGGPVWAGGVDSYARAAGYVAAVRGQAYA